MQAPTLRHCLVVADARQPDFVARWALGLDLWKLTWMTSAQIGCCLIEVSRV